MVNQKDVDAAERIKEKTAADLEEVKAKLATQKEVFKSKAAFRDQIDGQLKFTRTRTVQIRSVLEDQQAKLEQLRKEQEELKKECLDAEHVMSGEQGALQASQEAHWKLIEARASLVGIREELAALAGDPARQAALEVAGGELPENVVPRTKAISSKSELHDPVELWARCGAQGEVPDALRLVCTSQGVITALAHSLAVRAGEMRENLRQWSFARSATTRIEELKNGLETDLRNLTARSKKLAAERDELRKTKQAGAAELEKERELARLLESRQEVLQKSQTSVQESHHKLQEMIESQSRQLEEADRLHKRTDIEHILVNRHVESVQSSLANHAEEVDRRGSAARQLAVRAAEQADKAEQDLREAHWQLESFRQANSAYLEAQAILGDRIKAEREAIETTKEEYDTMEMQLEALAENYLAALPTLPGLEEIIQAPGLTGPTSVTGLRKARGSRPASATLVGHPDAAPEGRGTAGGLEAASMARGGRPASAMQETKKWAKERARRNEGTTPQEDPPGTRPVDISGSGVLTAGGRIVLSM